MMSIFKGRIRGSFARRKIVVLGATALVATLLIAPAASASNAPSLSTAKRLIATLFAGYSKSATSPSSEYKFMFAHDYPGAFDEKGFFACTLNSDNINYTETGVAKLSTVTPVGAYRFKTAFPLFLLRGVQLNGFTYNVTAHFIPGDTQAPYNAGFPVTILNGQAYFFFSPNSCANVTPLHVVASASGNDMGGELASYTAEDPSSATFSITTTKPQTIFASWSFNCQTPSGANKTVDLQGNLKLPIINKVLEIPASMTSCFISVSGNPNQGNSITVTLKVATL